MKKLMRRDRFKYPTSILKEAPYFVQTVHWGKTIRAVWIPREEFRDEHIRLIETGRAVKIRISNILIQS